MTARSRFERTLAVRRAEPGRYDASVDPAWNGPSSPNGGVLAATMLRAAQAELGPEGPPPRTVAAQFLDAPAAGEAEISVEILRTGRRVAATEARLYQGGRLLVLCSIIHSAPRADSLPLQRAAPQAPPPDLTRVGSARPLAGAPPVFSSLEIDPVLGGIPMSRQTQAVSGGWIAIAGDDEPLDAARLVALCDLWWPPVFAVTETPVGVPTLQLTVHLREVATPAKPPALARFRTEHVAEAHLEEHGELWSGDGRLLAESVQLSLLRNSVG